MAKVLLDEVSYVETLLHNLDSGEYDKSLVDISQSQLIYLLAKYLYENEEWENWESKDGNKYTSPKIWSEKKVIDTETGEITIEKKINQKALAEKTIYLANQLDNLLLRFNLGGYESYKMFSQLKKACSTVMRYDLRLKQYPEGIPLLSDELENIKKCETDREKKVLFACYMFARYRDKNGRIDDDIVKKQLFDMANVKGTKLELNKVVKSLREKGFISQSFVNSNITIWVKMGTGDKVMMVTDFNTLGNQIMVFLKHDYKMCKICKRLFKIKDDIGRPPIYCNKCAKIIKNEQNKQYYHKSCENLGKN